MITLPSTRTDGGPLILSLESENQLIGASWVSFFITKDLNVLSNSEQIFDGPAVTEAASLEGTRVGAFGLLKKLAIRDRDLS